MHARHVMQCAATLFALCGCNANYSNQPPSWFSEEAAAYQSGIEAVIRFLQDKSETCAGPDVSIAQGSIDRLAEAPQIPNYVRDRIQVIFALADAAKMKKCYDLADEGYHQIINTYIGLAYAGYRDRAKVALDDIRDARH